MFRFVGGSHNLPSHCHRCICSEGLLLELTPSLDKQTVKRIARKLASLRPFQSLVRHKRSGRKEYLKKLARELIGNMQQEQKVSSSSATVTREVSDDEEVSTTRLNCSSRVDRHHLLINKVGEKKYNDILLVTKQIRDIRQRSVVWTKFSHQNIEQEEERLPVSKILPTPIADLYFRSPLVEAMNVVDAKTIASLDEAPEPSSCIVHVSDWDKLLLNAKSQLAAFRNFVNENVREDEDLSFRCSSGLCGIARRHSP